MARNLLDAIRNDDEALARDIILRGAYGFIDSQTSKREGTALFLACSKGFVDLVRLLLEKQASVTAKNKHSATPLHGAAENGHFHIASFLIQQGADVNAKTLRGDTPLHYASYRGFPNLVQCLVESGADPGIFNVNSTTPIMEAAGQGHRDIEDYLTAVLKARSPQNARLHLHDSLIILDPPVEEGHRSCPANFQSSLNPMSSPPQRAQSHNHVTWSPEEKRSGLYNPNLTNEQQRLQQQQQTREHQLLQVPNKQPIQQRRQSLEHQNQRYRQKQENEQKKLVIQNLRAQVPQTQVGSQNPHTFACKSHQVLSQVQQNNLQKPTLSLPSMNLPNLSKESSTMPSKPSHSLDQNISDQKVLNISCDENTAMTNTTIKAPLRPNFEGSSAQILLNPPELQDLGQLIGEPSEKTPNDLKMISLCSLSHEPEENDELADFLNAPHSELSLPDFRPTTQSSHVGHLKARHPSSNRHPSISTSHTTNPIHNAPIYNTRAPQHRIKSVSSTGSSLSDASSGLGQDLNSLPSDGSDLCFFSHDDSSNYSSTDGPEIPGITHFRSIDEEPTPLPCLNPRHNGKMSPTAGLVPGNSGSPNPLLRRRSTATMPVIRSEYRGIPSHPAHPTQQASPQTQRSLSHNALLQQTGVEPDCLSDQTYTPQQEVKKLNVGPTRSLPAYNQYSLQDERRPDFHKSFSVETVPSGIYHQTMDYGDRNIPSNNLSRSSSLSSPQYPREKPDSRLMTCVNIPVE